MAHYPIQAKHPIQAQDPIILEYGFTNGIHHTVGDTKRDPIHVATNGFMIGMETRKKVRDTEQMENDLVCKFNAHKQLPNLYCVDSL